MKDYTKMKVAVIIALAITSAYDIWLVISGNVDLWHYWPGVLEVGCIFWLVIIRHLDQNDRDDARHSQASPPSRK